MKTDGDTDAQSGRMVGEKWGLARVSHQHSSRFGQTVFSDVEESSEGRVKLTLPRMAMKTDGDTDAQSGRMVGEISGLEK